MPAILSLDKVLSDFQSATGHNSRFRWRTTGMGDLELFVDVTGLAAFEEKHHGRNEDGVEGHHDETVVVEEARQLVQDCQT